jgi:MFS family permease
MYTLEDDDETSSRIRKQDLVGLAETQGLPGDALKARKTRLLPSDEVSTNPGIIVNSDSFSDVEQLEFNAQDATLAAAVPYASPSSAEDRTLVDFPHGQEPLGPLPPTNPLPPTIEEEPGKKSNRRAIAALTVACIAVFFTALDQTVVVTALPKIIPDLQFDSTVSIPTQLDHAAWIISAYLLGFVVVMPLMGRVSDIYGRRRIFLLCLAIFGVGSILCALAPVMNSIFDLGSLSGIGIDTSSQTLLWLVVARLIQAVGGGAIVPIAMAVASDFYGHEKRGLALGIVGAVTEAGGAIGPLYGAVIADHWGWQAIFYLNVPLVIALLVASWFFIPRGRRLLQGIDWLGAALLAVSLACLSMGLAQQGSALNPVTTSSSSSANNPVALLLAVLFLGAFVFVELKVRWPVIDLANFKRLTFSAASIVSLLIGVALIIAIADIPLYIDTVLPSSSVLQSGLALLRLTLMIPIGAVIGGWLCHRISCRWVGVISLIITALGFFLMNRWSLPPTQWEITISTMVTGLGFGLVIAPIGTTAINSLWPSQAGVASAVVTTLRMIGMTLGLSLLTSWAMARFQQLITQSGTGVNYSRAAHTTYTEVFLIAAFLCLAALIPAFFLWRREAPIAEPEEHAILLYEDETTLSPAILKRRKQKRLLIAAISLFVIFALAGGLTAEWFIEDAAYAGNNSNPSNRLGQTNSGGPSTGSITSGPRMFQLALDKDALTSIFASQLGTQQSALSDLTAAPGPNDSLTLGFNLHINADSIQRVIPVEIDGTIGLDNQQNLQIIVQQLKRDGVVADANTTTSMQNSLNEMLANTVMSTLHNTFNGAKLVSVHTSTTVNCAQQTEMLVLLVEMPAVEGVAAQPTPLPICLKGPVDLTQVLPH